MSSRRSQLWRVFFALLAVSVGLAAGAEVLRHVAAWGVGEVVQARAGARGLTVSWDVLRLGYDASVRVEGLEVYGLGDTSVDAGLIEARWTLDALAAGQRGPDFVHIEGMEAVVDLESLRREVESSKVQRGAKVSSSGSSAWPQMSAVWPSVSMKGSRVTLRGVPVLGDVRVEGMSAHGGEQAQARGTLVGRCVEGCGPDAQTLRGQWGHGDRETWASVTLAEPVKMEVPGADAGPVSLHVQRLSLALGPEGLKVGVGDVSMPLRVENLEGDLHIDEVVAQFENIGQLRAKRPAQVVLRKPSVHVRAVVDAPGAGRELAARPAAYGRRLEAFYGALEAVRGGLGRAKDIKLRVEDGEFVYAPLDVHLTSLVATVDAQHLDVEADWRGGHVGGRVEVSSPALRLRARGLTLRALRTLHWLPDPVEVIGPVKSLDGVLGADVALDVGEKRLGVRGRVSLEAGELGVEGLSAAPIMDQALDMTVAMVWKPGAKAGFDVEVESATLRLPSREEGPWVEVAWSGELRRLGVKGRKPRLVLDVQVGEVSCARALGAVPAALITHLKEEAVVKGRFAPTLHLALDLEQPRRLDFDLEGLPGGCQMETLGKYSPAYLATGFKQEVREGVSRPGIFVGPGSDSYVPLRAIPEHTRAATWLTEDVKFFEHDGLAPHLIRRALKLNLEKGRYVYGGSTLSQQLVKNLFLTRDKTLGRKLEEALIVWKMEEVLSKERILELYMNCIEFGPDVYGIGRASRHYFGKPPSKLTALEGAFLAALKPAPWQGAWFKKSGRSPGTGFWQERMDRIMKRIHRFGHISQEELDAFGPDYVVTFAGHAPKKPKYEAF